MKKMLLIIILTLLALVFLNAKGNTVPKINPPANVSIVYSDSTVTIGWDAVPNTEKYYIYNQDDPYDVFVLVDSTASITWNGNFTENKKFFYVSAKETPPPAGFVFVQGGTFQMGDEVGDLWEGCTPVHQVTLDSYYIGACEVTQAEWTATMGSNPASGYGVGNTYPVYYVSWYSIMKYCNLRSMAEGFLPCYKIKDSTDPTDWGDVPTNYDTDWDAVICDWTAKGYRLPTDAEFEYAARGGIHYADGYLYSGSNDVNTVSWNKDNSNSISHEVGKKTSNQLGIHDMNGNVWEWVWDWWHYYTTDAQVNPVGPLTPVDGYSYRVERGGSWNSRAHMCRVAYRSENFPYSGYSGLGFRLSRTP